MRQDQFRGKLDVCGNYFASAMPGGKCLGCFQHDDVSPMTVDTHVKRLAARLGFTSSADPGRIESDLMEVFPREEWNRVAHQLIAHGRAVCHARRPECARCRLADLCPSANPS